MLNQINGLHHITSMASDAVANNRFFTRTLGLRRVKQTVNFDAPDVYHLYYGDGQGSAGTVMTYFPFPRIGQGRAGTGEVGITVFAVPEGSLGFWQERLAAHGAGTLGSDAFGQKRLTFSGPDRDQFALVEVADDPREGWVSADIAPDRAIRGFHSAVLRLRDGGASEELLRFMGYQHLETGDGVKRFALEGNGANVIDIETVADDRPAQLGAGSVHHIAFSVADRSAQAEVRRALLDTGYQVTPVIDRDYFWAIYFRTPGGVLFEVATNEPGFARDEDATHLGETLKLPAQHQHLRPFLETHLKPLED